MPLATNPLRSRPSPRDGSREGGRSNRDPVLIAGVLAVLGVFAVGVGEFALHYSASGYAGAGEFRFLLHVPGWRLTLGHFLGVLFAPVYSLGYWHVYMALRPADRSIRLILLGAAIYTFGIANVWLGSRAGLAGLVQAQAEGLAPAQFTDLLAAYHLHSESLIQIVRVGVLLISALFVALVARGRTSYPRWIAAASPIVLLALVFASYLALPAVGGYLVPTAMNAAHVLFFGLSSLAWARTGRHRLDGSVSHEREAHENP